MTTTHADIEKAIRKLQRVAREGTGSDVTELVAEIRDMAKTNPNEALLYARNETEWYAN